MAFNLSIEMCIKKKIPRYTFTMFNDLIHIIVAQAPLQCYKNMQLSFTKLPFFLLNIKLLHFINIFYGNFSFYFINIIINIQPQK